MALSPGSGLTGSAFAACEPVLVQDVTSDPRYREAVPGVVAELAVPLTVNRHMVGVLNVDAPAFIDAEQVEAVLAAARLLEQAFSRTGISSYRGSPLSDFGWHAARVAQSRTVRELAQATACAGVDIAHLQSAMLWTRSGGSMVPRGTAGARANDIVDLSRGRARAAGQLVSHVASSYSTGPVISRTFGPMGLLRDRGFGTVFVAALRDRGTPSGLMVLAGPEAGIMEVEAVHALELLSVLAGVTLARIGIGGLTTFAAVPARPPSGIAVRPAFARPGRSSQRITRCADGARMRACRLPSAPPPSDLVVLCEYRGSIPRIRSRFPSIAVVDISEGVPPGTQGDVLFGGMGAPAPSKP